jgi:hypothetical protein
MTTAMKRAIEVLDTLSLADLKTADDAALREFWQLALNWADLARKTLVDREHARQKK